MSYFWLSFCNPDKPKGSQFLGACIVEADSVYSAVPTAHLWDCNPGGEVLVMEIPKEREHLVKSEDLYCLFGMDKINRKFGGAL